MHVELPRRVKEILEEHLHFEKEERNVKHPAAGTHSSLSANGKCLSGQVIVLRNCSKIIISKKPTQNIYVIACRMFRNGTIVYSLHYSFLFFGQKL